MGVERGILYLHFPIGVTFRLRARDVVVGGVVIDRDVATQTAAVAVTAAVDPDRPVIVDLLDLVIAVVGNDDDVIVVVIDDDHKRVGVVVHNRKSAGIRRKKSPGQLACLRCAYSGSDKPQ